MASESAIFDADLQETVDALAERAGHPVAVEDPRFRLIAYSAHQSGLDDVRLRSILTREAPPGVGDWLRELGVHRAEGPVRVPENRSLGMRSRLCVPLRWQRALVGYLWLLDASDGSLGPDLPAAIGAARELAPLLGERRAAHRAAGRVNARRIDRLLGATVDGRAIAAQELVESGALMASRHHVGIVLQVAVAQGQPIEMKAGLAAAVARLRRQSDRGQVLGMAHVNEVVVICTLDGAGEADRLAARLAEIAADDVDAEPIVGLGELVGPLIDVADSVAQARAACRVARAAPEHRPVSRWSRLGTLGTLAGLDDVALELLATSAALCRLESHDVDGTLSATLWAYLDRGCDVPAAAAAMQVHRASLYYRLRRIEKLAEIDLRHGDDRLALHLALTARRLLEAPAAPHTTRVEPLAEKF